MAVSTIKHPAANCFEAIFKSCEFCFAVIDAACRLVEANPGLEKLLGFPAEELAGKKFTELLLARYDSDTSLIEKTLNYFFENPRYVYSAKLSRRDGSVVGVRLMSLRTA